MARKRDVLSERDFSEIAHWIKQEKERRKERRKDREKIWKEVDRQVAMTPPFKGPPKSGKVSDWYPELELPLQFHCLEVNAADARRLMFPRGQEWYRVASELSDDYLETFAKRHGITEKDQVVMNMSGLSPAMFFHLMGKAIGKKAMVGETPTPMNIDQETADTLVKATIDHFHFKYDFRQSIDLCLTDCLKYGTAVSRTIPVKLAKFSHEFRGVKAETIIGPATIPVSVKEIFLDDTPIAVQHEGMNIAPVHIRCAWQNIRDLTIAAQKGGADKGWRMKGIKKLIDEGGDTEKRGFVEVLEAEGDIWVPKTEGSLFFPNCSITVAVGKTAEVIRFRTNDYPFSPFDVWTYMRDEINSPYGSSPLMKGQPVQEAASLVYNDIVAASALNAKPPVSYDKNDPNFQGTGGPEIYPGAMWGADSPNSIEVHKMADVAALATVYAALIKQYEDLTAVNDPRRGGQTKSHTTAEAVMNEVTRGLSRTDDFVIGVETGPLTSILYKQYDIIKNNMKSQQAVPINAGGIEGWVNLSAADLPEKVFFSIEGSSGVLDERQRQQNFMLFAKFAIELMTVGAQLQQPVNVDLQGLISEGAKLAGITNIAKFVRTAENVSVGTASPTSVPGTPPMLPEGQDQTMAAGGAAGGMGP